MVRPWVIRKNDILRFHGITYDDQRWLEHNHNLCVVKAYFEGTRLCVENEQIMGDSTRIGVEFMCPRCNRHHHYIISKRYLGTLDRTYNLEEIW